MNCKNCSISLSPDDQYCAACGAKVVSHRLSLKGMWQNFARDFFGWDNKYFKTLKQLLFCPECLFRDYLGGVRKRYVPPFVFLAIGTALAMLVFNQFSEQYLHMASEMNAEQMEAIETWQLRLGGEDLANDPEKQEMLRQKMQEQMQSVESMQRGTLTYFNIVTFLLVPFYALISFWVFGKPYNYAEHLIMGSYIQGFLFIVSIIVFLASVFINPGLFIFTLGASLIYYPYAYARLYKHSFSEIVLKFLKFAGIMILALLISVVIGFLIGYISSKFL